MMVMEVIQRNFFRLLRGGAFGCTGEAIEPMSPWKWNTLYNISLIHGVATLVYDGIKLYGDDFFMQIPPGLKAKWEGRGMGKGQRATGMQDRARHTAILLQRP